MAKKGVTRGCRERVLIRRSRAFELRALGVKSLREIGEELDISEAQVRRDIKAYTDAYLAEEKEHARQLRVLMTEQLQKIIDALVPKAIGGDCKYAETISKLMVRQAKLMGLDAPEKKEVREEIVHFEMLFEAGRGRRDEGEIVEGEAREVKCLQA